MEAARRAGLTTVAHVPDAFAEDRGHHVVAEAAGLAELGCDEIALEEGGRAATPIAVRRLLQDVASATGGAPLRVGLRERHGIGLVNALVAMKSGVRHFDTTLGGVDGALPAEDLLFLAGELEVASAVNRADLVAGAAELERSWVRPCQDGPIDSHTEGANVTDRLTGERLVDDMTEAERARAERVEAVLPALRAAAAKADEQARFPIEHVTLLRDAGLLGLVVPEEYGGLRGDAA